MISNRLRLTSVFLLIFASVSFARATERVSFTDTIPGLSSDTARIKKMPGKWNIANKFNTGSMFFFTGVVANHHPAFDTKLTYNNNGWGGMLFKSFDLTGQSLAMDYALIVLHKNINISKKLMISPQIGTQLNQDGSIADKTSDILTNLAIVYRITPSLTISNDAVFQNLVYTHRPNWTNRFRILFQRSDFSAAVLLWDRNSIFNNPGYSAAGIDLGYSGIKLSPAINLLVGAQSVSVFRQDTPRKSGLMFFIGVGI